MPLKTHIDDQPSINLTPMIDVVFLLIIFFMVGTKFTELERKLGLEVPEVSKVNALSPAPERQVVNVFNDGRIELDRETLSLDELVDRLSTAQARNPDYSVLVRGDAEGSFQSVATVLGACREAGVTNMGISVRLARRPR